MPKRPTVTTEHAIRLAESVLSNRGVEANRPKTYKDLKEKWRNCKLCKLCNTRDRIVLLRGTVPAPILFVGEAPGLSENVLGLPFVGPSGKLMDELLLLANLRPGDYAITNLIACAPIAEGGGVVEQPPLPAIKACKDRLVDTIELVAPEIIITVGTIAERWFNEKHLGPHANLAVASIVHPAAILRMPTAQQSLAFQRAVIQVKDAIEDYYQSGGRLP